MSTRLRVRDLATELDISSKDLMTLLRELKIPAKSHMSSLTDEEVGQVRNHHQNGPQRPRSWTRAPPRASSCASGTRSLPPRLKPRKRTAKHSPRTKLPPRPGAEAPAKTVTETAEATEKSAARKPSRAVIVTPARIIEEVPSAKAAPEESAKEETPVTEAPIAEAPVSVEEVPAEPVTDESADAGAAAAEKTVQASAEAPGETGDEATAKTEGESEEAKRAPKKTKKAKPAPPSVQVKIISRPTIVEFPDTRVDGQPVRPMGPAARPMGPAGYTPRPSGPGGRPSGPGGPGGPGGQRPSAPRPSGPANLGAPPRPAPETEGAKDSRGKKKKGRRTVEAADLYRKEEFSMGKGKKAQRAEARRAGGARAQAQNTQPLKASKRKIRIDDTIRLTDLAHQMGIKAQDLIKKLFSPGCDGHHQPVPGFRHGPAPGR